MHGFIKKCFFKARTFSSSNASKSVLMNNQECKVRPVIMNIKSNESSFYPYNILVKVFNIMSRTNETRHIFWHETCKCKSRLDGSVCNSKQQWNKDKCIRECRELIDQGIIDNEFIWNFSNCECELENREYLDYENCKCRKMAN